MKSNMHSQLAHISYSVSFHLGLKSLGLGLRLNLRFEKGSFSTSELHELESNPRCLEMKVNPNPYSQTIPCF